MKKRIIWLILSCFMVVTPLLASCAPAVTEEEAAPPEEEAADNITATIKFIVPKELPSVTVGVPYGYSFATATNPTGGNPPYTFVLGSGVGFPPFGLILDLNGLLSGTPTAAGTRTFEVCVKDLAGNQACGNTSLTVIPAPEVVKEQAWEIVDEFGHKATLTVDSSGHFTGSGWVGSTPSGTYDIPITNGVMSGTSISFHANASYDNGQGTISGTASGTLNEPFPFAESASGVWSGTISDPLGTRNFSIKWTATRKS